MRPSLRAGIIAALASSFVLGCAEQRPTAVVGSVAPDYAALSLAGDSVSLADHRGRVVLVNIWATWCHPCRDELPVLQKLHEADSGKGLDIIGVSVDAYGEERKVRDFAKSFGLSYPIWLDPDERVTHTFLAIGVPATFLIGRDGTLMWRHVGPIRSNDPRLMPVLREALEAP